MITTDSGKMIKYCTQGCINFYNFVAANLILNKSLELTILYVLLKLCVCHLVMDPCRNRNGDCEDICINKNGNRVCECHPGYKLSADQRHCEGEL